jgi:hypothetical protein
MAKGKKEPATEETMIDENLLKAPAEGFEEISSGDRVVGWFAIQAGNAIQGILRGFFEVDSKFTPRGKPPEKKRVYRIEVTSSDPAGQGPTLYRPGDDVDIAQGQPGDLLGIDEKGFLQSLRKVEAGQQVWIACLGKEEPSEQYPQGAWKFRVMASKVGDKTDDKGKSDEDIPL